jgi:C1A family cysteine protease
MKTSFKSFFVAITFLAFVFYGCTKSDVLNNTGDQQQALTSTSDGLHVYGLLPMTPDQFMNLPVYSMESLPARLRLKDFHSSSKVILDNPPVRDQGQIGSCTAFCGAECDEILYYYKNNKNWTSILSPAFVYYCERVLIEKQKISSDNGAYMVDISKALQNYGDCLENSYPYPSSDRSTAYKTPPTGLMMTEGLTYQIASNDPNKVSTSYGLVSDVATTKNFLANNIPVMLGFNVYDNSRYTLFEGLNTTNYIYNPLTASGSLVSGARLLGGHAVPIIGYDDNYISQGVGAFCCLNSWGTSWGNQGIFYMPYTVFNSTRIVPRGDVFGIIPD